MARSIIRGNSGRAALDSAGRLIGAVNTAIYSPPGAYAGIASLPIPSDKA